MAGPVALPRRYRPLGARLASAVAAAALVGVIAFLWLMLPDEIQDKFTVFQRATLVGVFVALLALLNGVFRTSALAAEQGLTIVNGYRVRHFEWAEVVRISLSRNRPWALLDLADGTTVAVMALQSSDGDRATRSAREVAGLIAFHSRTERDT